MVNTTGSSVSVRIVATLVPVGMVMTAWPGPTARTSRGARAGVGGNRWRPISSRNLTYSRSGTRLSRYSSWSVMNANVSISVTPGSDTL